MKMKMSKKMLATIIALLLIIIIALSTTVTIFLLDGDGEGGGQPTLPIDNSAENWNGKQELPKASLGDTPAIAIPGFKEMVFIADQKIQSVNFYNPEINDCLFLMSLYVDDELLWQSGYVKPGDCYYQIELSKSLEASENFKNGCLRIQCYKPDGTVLNSARVNFNLLVTRR